MRIGVCFLALLCFYCMYYLAYVIVGFCLMSEWFLVSLGRGFGLFVFLGFASGRGFKVFVGLIG